MRFLQFYSIIFLCQVYISNLTKAELKALVQESIKEFLSDSDFQMSDIPHQAYITISELCKRVDVSKQTIHNWRKRKLITARKIGARVLFDWAEIRGSIEKNPSSFGHGREYKYKFNTTATDMEKFDQMVMNIKAKIGREAGLTEQERNFHMRYYDLFKR